MPPSTLRLTEATPLRHQGTASATKMMSANYFEQYAGRHQLPSTILNVYGVKQRCCRWLFLLKQDFLAICSVCNVQR